MNIKDTTKYLLKNFKQTPRVCIMLGSGLNDFKNKISEKSSVYYKDVPGFYNTSVEGHTGEFIFGYINNIPILCASGRFHYYEGFTFSQIGSIVRLFNALEPKLSIITNSSGCLKTDWEIGSFMLIDKFLDFSFIDDPNSRVHKVQAIKEQNKVFKIARENGINLNKGTYAFTTGPSYETDAEVREIINLGGNAVGMSTFPEFMVSDQLNLNALFISCLTNYGAGLTNKKISHDDVLKNAEKSKHNFWKLIIGIIESIAPPKILKTVSRRQ